MPTFTMLIVPFFIRAASSRKPPASASRLRAFSSSTVPSQVR